MYPTTNKLLIGNLPEATAVRNLASSKRIFCYICVVHLILYFTFLPDRAPDGDNEDTDDGENQKGQNATYHCIRYCAVSLNHCAGV